MIAYHRKNTILHVMRKIKIALLQMRTDIDAGENLHKAEDLIIFASGEGADIVVLPEMFSIPYMNEYMKVSMQPVDGEIISSLCSLARDNNVNILAGTIAEAVSPDKCYNTSVFINRDGKVLAAHRKLHLYDVDFDGITVKESDVVMPGSTVTVFDTEFGKAGIAVCYDLRFADMFSKMSKLGAELIFVPAAFNMVTGPPHWELLLRARALDNQVFIAACSPSSNPDLPYDPYGHSLVADPWGCVVSSAGRAEAIIYAEIDLDYVDTVRKKIPLKLHRRDGIY